MGNIFTMSISLILVNNVVLTKFLGICPFIGVSKSSKNALGMGLAVLFVILMSSILTYGLYYLVLVPFNITYMETIVYILVIASFVQFVEMFLKKFSPALYKSLGIYLPLITTNCVVLFVAKDNISAGYNFVEMLTAAIATPIGFMLMLYVFACIRERLESADVPAVLKGNPIALIILGTMALAMAGLAGIA